MALGDLSAAYESNENPGCVSTGYGDLGGISYGAYQLVRSMHSLNGASLTVAIIVIMRIVLISTILIAMLLLISGRVSPKSIHKDS